MPTTSDGRAIRRRALRSAVLVGALVGPPESAVSRTPQQAPAATNGDAKSDADVDPRSLLAEPLPPTARLGLALRLAAGGQFEDAAAAIEELCAAPETDELLRARLGREAHRLRDLAQWRRDFVEQWKKGTKKLQVEHDGRSTTGTLKDVDGGDVVLLDTKGREMRLALAALDAEQILRRCTEAKLEVGTGTVRGYAALVAGRKNWERTLAGGPEGAAELQADASDWSVLVAQGEAAARISRLAHAALPVNDAQATPLLADLGPLLSKKNASPDTAPLVEPRRAVLRRFASVCLRRDFDAVGIAGAGLRGRVLAKPDGVVRMTYLFDDPAEAEDWVPNAAAVMDRQGATGLKTTLDKSWVKIEGGALLARGIVGWMTRLEFTPPMSVAWKYTTHAPDRKNPTAETLTIRVSLCDDGKTSRAEAIDFFGVQSRDTVSGFTKEDNDLQQYTWDVPFHGLLTHDGTKVTYAVEGRPSHAVSCGPRRSGHVGLWIFSDAIADFDEVVIEGRVDPISLARLRDRWVEQRLAALEAGDTKPPGPEKAVEKPKR